MNKRGLILGFIGGLLLSYGMASQFDELFWYGVVFVGVTYVGMTLWLDEREEEK